MVNATQSQNARDLVAGQEYHAFSLRITHSKTVGTVHAVVASSPS
jgi:hypothetical protein